MPLRPVGSPTGREARTDDFKHMIHRFCLAHDVEAVADSCIVYRGNRSAATVTLLTLIRGAHSSRRETGGLSYREGRPE